MRVVKKNVYYCDFCKKRSLASLKKHELHCTGNPNRKCGMCKSSINLAPIIESLKQRFKIVDLTPEEMEAVAATEQGYLTLKCEWIGEPVTLAEIKRLVHNCPACILSVLRQTKLNYACCGLEKFDYQEACAKWFKESEVYNEPMF